MAIESGSIGVIVDRNEYDFLSGNRFPGLKPVPPATPPPEYARLAVDVADALIVNAPFAVLHQTVEQYKSARDAAKGVGK
jgi:hypothetical protein